MKDKDNFGYHIFGLNVLSPFRMNNLMESESEDFDVHIRWGNVPDRLNNIRNYGVNFMVSDNEFLLQVQNIAKYYAKSGRELIIEPFNHADQREIILFLLSSAFAALLQQRGMLTLHGGSLIIDNKGIVIAGNSAAGKSSVLARLLQKGYQFISDDMSVITFQNNIPFLNPGYKAIKLWEDSCQALHINTKPYMKVRSNMNKYWYEVDTHFFNPFPLQHIYILQISNEANYDNIIPKLKDKFLALKKNTYWFKYLENTSNQTTHFFNLVQLLQNVRITIINRPRYPENIIETADYLINDILNHKRE